MSRTQRDNIFTQAAFEKNVWEVTVSVMNKFELGQLKGQKLNRKHLISTPEFKQHLLQPLHHLEPQFQQSVLQNVVDQEISLSEMKKSAADFRSMGIVKSTFLRLTSMHTWAEAAEKFPLFTSTKRLSQYTSLDFKHTVPEVFRTYCQAALDSTATPSSSPPPTMNFNVNGVSVRLVEAKFSSISAQYL